MRQLLYSRAADRDFIAIARFIRDGSGSRQAGTEFVNLLRQQCRRLAALPGTLGRARPELRPDMRSFAVRGYLIFFRYEGSAVEIVRIIERHRDLAAQFDDRAD